MTRGDRFYVIYHIRGDEATALAKAKAICLEQTVELGDELVPDGIIREWIVGQIERFSLVQDGLFAAKIGYAVETSAFELPQLLNVIFGNTSIKAGIRVEQLELPDSLLRTFPGPRFGVRGLRNILGVDEKPLLCTALKPMGKSAVEIAELAYAFALGGIDVIKDDHGLTDQPFCPYRDRVQACVEAIARANRETGKRCFYVPNVTAPALEIAERVSFAQQTGAGGILIAPGLTGFDTMRVLAENESVNLPIFSHPAFLGSLVTSPENGLSHSVLFGQLQRLAGADVSIYPNYGGRFGFTRDECQQISASCLSRMGHYPAIFPSPGGGMTMEKVPDMLALYGHDVMFLMGGGLYGRSPDLADNVRYFLSLVGREE
ncbi:ribulose 1,5-bisphosphate carboxylase large subunit [candidate division KSB3 bacterium]|uniref:Ribulose 1,5-bisphosphate carboxylase large subunit n=1 Tax=candidate division KSB3 bacterium TaxID=2044937 RepID=A0A9D5JTK1_9BACT|nr:ribulose 1,5-bisphosphate carboxylase large subunit [candidate division KSB3 bacterium]MBD3323396.1 ribulose 1,5-bisphosphate carboxylase large subunit [candidate division KSB3 bacterium]